METRDKLFTEEQYLKQLKMYDEDISYYEQMHLSGKHIGYDSLFNYRLRYLLVQYSMGQDIDKLTSVHFSFVCNKVYFVLYENPLVPVGYSFSCEK